MAAQDPRQKFAAALAKELVSRRVEKKLLGGPVIRFGPFIPMCAFAFQTGALLGHTFAAEALAFATAFAMRSEVARRGLDHMKGPGLRELSPALARAKSPVEIVSRTEMVSAGVQGEWAAWLTREANQTVPADMAVQLVAIWAIRGAGLALRDGTPVVQLISDSYKFAPETIKDAREHGVIDRTNIQNWTLQGATEEAASGFLEFVAEAYPEYLDELSACVPARAA